MRTKERPSAHPFALVRGREVAHRWLASATVARILEPRSFSLYAIRVASEEQIQQWADEAEAGYNVDVLKRRGRGRPGRGAEPMQIVAVRLTAEELDALDAAAAKNDMSRSEAIRAALAHFAA
jgi:Ribbon-helix-helix protein, copG family